MAAAPTLDAAGAADGCVAVLTDVTDGRHLEQERQRALNELREADRRKDEFLAMLSHELRNPLAPILNAVEVSSDSRPRDAKTSPPSIATIIARQAKHMKRLLDDLLDVSRVSQGKIQLQQGAHRPGRGPSRQAVEVSRPLTDREAAAGVADGWHRNRWARGRPDASAPGVRQPAQQRRQVHRRPAATSRSTRPSRTARRSSRCGTTASG